jgi:hypothetical protein
VANPVSLGEKKELAAPSSSGEGHIRGEGMVFARRVASTIVKRWSGDRGEEGARKGKRLRLVEASLPVSLLLWSSLPRADAAF